MSTQHDGRDPDVRFEFDHDRRAPADARRRMDELLPDPDDPIADDVVLATSELVTNVVQHTADGGEVRAWDPRPDVPLRLEVADPDPTIPASPPVAPPVGGRGLTIVATVADAWGVERDATGKVVWAEFDRNQPRTQHDADEDPSRPTVRRTGEG